MTDARLVRDVLVAASERLFVERAVLQRLAEWAPPEATIPELLVGRDLVRPTLRNVVRRCCADVDGLIAPEPAAAALPVDEHVHGAARLWMAWADAADRASAVQSALSSGTAAG